MRTVFLAAAAVGALCSVNAIAADVPKSTIDGGCDTWGLSVADLKTCHDQMARAKSDADRMAVQKRFQMGGTSGAASGDVTRTTGDTRGGILPDQKKNAPGSGSQGAADKKGTPERTP